MRNTLARVLGATAAATAWLATAAAARAQSEGDGSGGPVFPYILMLLFTILVMAIICVPSRKS